MKTTDKRTGRDRRDDADRRRGGPDTRSECEKQLQGERRTGVDRRMLQDRRAGA
ncbi:MAG: hypothetical protein MPJ78_19165 [Hyphomicrobiaceae bacterium]|nr:hypothetical protein [Hyphomicrobiaceae bacterium]